MAYHGIGGIGEATTSAVAHLLMFDGTLGWAIRTNQTAATASEAMINVLTRIALVPFDRVPSGDNDNDNPDQFFNTHYSLPMAPNRDWARFLAECASRTQWALQTDSPERS